MNASSKTIAVAPMMWKLRRSRLIDLHPILLPKTMLQTVDDGLLHMLVGLGKK
jgi:hypothetical protein